MAESWNGSDEFQVPGLKFQRAGEKALSLNWVCWDWISRKGREARKGTDLKLGNTRNTLKEKNRKPRNRRTTRKGTELKPRNTRNTRKGRKRSPGIGGDCRELSPPGRAKGWILASNRPKPHFIEVFSFSNRPKRPFSSDDKQGFRAVSTGSGTI